MNRNIYQKLKKVTKILKNKELNPILKDIIGGYEQMAFIQGEEKEHVMLTSSTTGEQIQVEWDEEMLIFTKKIGNTFLQKDFLTVTNFQVLSISLEIRTSGIIVTTVDKIYKKVTNTKRQLLELEAARSLYTDAKIKKIYPNLNLKQDKITDIFTKILGSVNKIYSLNKPVTLWGEIPNMTTYFDIYTKRPYLSQEQYTPNHNTAYVRLNMEDVSIIFQNITGPNKIQRIYDLYNGHITPQNKQDIYAIRQGTLGTSAFDLRSAIGITTQEYLLVGKKITPKSPSEIAYLTKFIKEDFYTECRDLNNREEILKCINHRPSVVENARHTIERILKIPYEEFEQLDYDEQQKLLSATHDESNLKKLIKKISPFQHNKENNHF